MEMLLLETSGSTSQVRLRARLSSEVFFISGVVAKRWEVVRGSGSPPSCLQGHTMLEYKDVLYVFGGELSFCNDQETPLWMFDIKVFLRFFVNDQSKMLSGENLAEILHSERCCHT